MRDAMIIPISDKEELVITTDCSGGVGQSEDDIVKVPYEVVAYFTTRVALMELLSVGAKPICYTLSNLTTDGYQNIHHGVLKALNEVDISNLENISSSETNFELKQSGLGISFIGKRSKTHVDKIDNLLYAVIGYPLVGDEVVDNPEKIVSLEMFKRLVGDKRIVDILPVGSKGIKFEMKEVFNKTVIKSELDMIKSSGPSTCIIISFEDRFYSELQSELGSLFNLIECTK
ncbi:ATP-binding protein [Mycoplasmatota bacterium WC44]